MDLNQLADLGEFIGGVAVLLTLLYLAAQLRQNTQVATAQLHQEIARMSTEVAINTSQDDLDNLARAMASPSEMTPAQLRHACLRFMGVANYYETLFYARERGEVAAEFWESRRERLMNFLVPAKDSLWPMMKTSFGAGFQRYVDREIMPATPEDRASWMR